MTLSVTTLLTELIISFIALGTVGFSSGQQQVPTCTSDVSEELCCHVTTYRADNKFHSF